MDLFEKLMTDLGPLGKWSELGHGYFTFPKLEGEIKPRMMFRGKEVLTWSLNNYLGLANHPEVRKVDAEAAERWGLAYPMGSRMMSGNTNLHEKLENELADHIGKQDAMLLNYGYQGIMSIIDAILDRRDIVVYDAECHACIIDGVRLHQGKRFVFPHNDIEGLEKQLKRATKMAQETGGGILVITEGVFGMSGNQGKLKEIVELKDKYQFRLMVDDAHGWGTLGKTGAGAGEEQGCQDGIDLYFSTFAKSGAGIGAFMGGEEKVINFLRNNTRSQIFAKSVPMPMVEGLLKRLDMVRNRPELREQLWNVVTTLQNGLREKGFNIGTTKSPVTPVLLSCQPEDAGRMVIDLRENFHIFCSGVVYPVVPKGVLMLRIIPTAAHSIDDVNETLEAFEKIADKLSKGVYAEQDNNVSV